MTTTNPEESPEKPKKRPFSVTAEKGNTIGLAAYAHSSGLMADDRTFDEPKLLDHAKSAGWVVKSSKRSGRYLEFRGSE